MRRRLQTLAAAIVIASGTLSALAQTVAKYDASKGSLPDSQGWTLNNEPDSPDPFIVGNLLHQGMTSTTGGQWFSVSPLAGITFTAGHPVEINVSMCILHSPYIETPANAVYPPSWRTGWEIAVGDSTGHFAGLGIAETGVRLTTQQYAFDPSNTPFIATPTTRGLHDFKLMVSPLGASVYAGSVLLGTVALANPEGLEEPNRALFGDLTQLAGQESLLSSASVGYRAAGDANFDGVVDFKDLVVLAQNYNHTSGASWYTGDFTFDGKVDFADLTLLAQNYNTQTGLQSDWLRAQSLVPEPSTALAAVLLGLRLGCRQRDLARR